MRAENQTANQCCRHNFDLGGAMGISTFGRLQPPKPILSTPLLLTEIKKKLNLAAIPIISEIIVPPFARFPFGLREQG